MTIGKKIYNLRKLAELSQESFAEKLNVSRQTVSKWERDECQPELDKVIAICELFNITTDELLVGEKQPRINPTLQELVDKNQMDRKKRTAIKVFLFSLGFLMFTIGLTVVMQLIDKATKGQWLTYRMDYLKEPPLNTFCWVAVIGMFTGVFMFIYEHVKNDKEE